MNNLKVRHWTGAFGVVSIALILVAQPLWFIADTAPRLEDTVKFSEYVARNNAIILTRTLADTLIMVCFLVFLVGFCRLIRQALSSLCLPWLVTRSPVGQLWTRSAATPSL